MKRAVVKWFSLSKGFGHATPEGGGEDVFLHYRNLPDSTADGGGWKYLVVGEVIGYVPTEGPKGTIATEIVLLESAARRVSP